MRLAALVAFAAILAGGCQAAPLPVGNVESRVAEAAAPRVTLGPGDRVSIQVLLHPESSTPPEGAVIDSDGRIDLPLLGPVTLGGLTPDEARARLGEGYGEYIVEPQVMVNVVSLGSRRVYVFGEMERPGFYPLDRPMTALQALTLAGGFRPGADRERVVLVRGTKDALQVYFFNGATPGQDGMVQVQPDDFLFVRLSGAGTYRDQMLPVVQSLVPPITGFGSLLLVADKLNE